MQNDAVNSDIVKKGYIRLRRINIAQWRKVYAVFRRASFHGRPRIEKYRNQKHFENAIIGSLEKEIALREVKSVIRLPREIAEQGVAITFGFGPSRMFTCEDELEVDEWQKLLEMHCLHAPSSTTSFKNGAVDVKDTYHVKLLPSQSLYMQGECQLQITADSIHLFSVEDKFENVVSWPLNAVRNFGCDEHQFRFEAGRYCPTGEGIFILRTVQGDEIYQKVGAATEAMAAMYRERTQSQLSHTRSLPLPPIPVQNLAVPPTLKHSISNPENSISTNPETPPPPPPRPEVTILERQTSVSPGYEQPVEDDIPKEFAPSVPQFSASNAVDPLGIKVPSKLNNNGVEDEYIYEERGLESAFRQFLKVRKEEPIT